MVDIKSFIGLSEDAALDALKASSGRLQIVRRDDESYPSDMMYDETRVKVELEKGIVVKAVLG